MYLSLHASQNYSHTPYQLLRTTQSNLFQCHSLSLLQSRRTHNSSRTSCRIRIPHHQSTTFDLYIYLSLSPNPFGSAQGPHRHSSIPAGIINSKINGTPKVFYSPISKLQSILAVANLLAHNNLLVCYYWYVHLVRVK